MSRRSADLKTTSYAMLGMLAIRDWSTYELAEHMERGVGRLWPPSARSNLFTEPKKLVALGLATATETVVGRRPRTEYSITAEGRRVLEDWLGSTGEPTRIESEPLLKLFFADQGTTEQAKATIAGIQAWAAARATENVAVARSYVVGNGPFPERAAVLALTGRFLSDFADMVSDWASWAAAVVDTWPDDPTQARPDWDTFEAIAGQGLPGPPRPEDDAGRTTPP
jgi:PadR family transcriptional regulator AphA